MSNPHLILIAGFAGSGKTYLGSELARRCWNLSYVDKDTVTRPLTEALLESQGIDKNDRESVEYLTHIRPFEYECLALHCSELLELGKDLVVTAPFLREVTSQEWIADLDFSLTQIGARRSLVWVQSDPDTIKRRLTLRGAARDTYKLRNWNKYVAALRPEIPEDLPPDARIFNNSGTAASSWDAQVIELANLLMLIT